MLLRHACLHQVHRRDADRLLEDVRVTSVPEVGVVRKRRRPGTELAVDEDRAGQHDVGQVGAATGVGVVADEGVAICDLIERMPGEDGLDDPHQRAKVHGRSALVLGDAVALGIEDA